MLGYARGALVKSGENVPDAKAVSVTRVSVFNADSPEDVDRELKRACEDLIQQCTTLSAQPIRQFMDKCTAYLSTRPSGAPSNLAEQAFATPDKVKEAHEAFKASSVAELQKWKSGLLLYLQDEETVKVLVPPAQVCLPFMRVYRVRQLMLHRTALLMPIDTFTTSSALSTTSPPHPAL